jgi:hypothetical protein
MSVRGEKLGYTAVLPLEFNVPDAEAKRYKSFNIIADLLPGDELLRHIPNPRLEPRRRRSAAHLGSSPPPKAPGTADKKEDRDYLHGEGTLPIPACQKLDYCMEETSETFKKTSDQPRPLHIQRRKAPMDEFSYDVDAEDFQWLQANHSHFPSLEEGTRDLIEVFTALERLYAQCVLHICKSDSTSSVAPCGEHGDHRRERSLFCDICGEAIADPAKLLECLECNTTVHPECYMTEIPRKNRSWTCDACQVAEHSTIVCLVCQTGGGTFLPLHVNPKRKSRSTAPAAAAPLKFAHVSCAMLFPEMFVDGEKRFVGYAEKLPKRRMNQLCAVCGKTAGACTFCHHPGCFVTMHPACAAKSHLIETVSTKSGIVRYAYCRDHFAPSVAVSTDIIAGLELHANAERHAEERLIAVMGSRESPTQADMITNERSVKNGKGLTRRRPLRSTEKWWAKIAAYWREKKNRRYEESKHLVNTINDTSSDILCAVQRPEILKLGQGKVRLARFLCLIPELQLYVAELVEGVPPLKDEETEEPLRQRNTRNNGNTRKLLEKMIKLEGALSNMVNIAKLIEQRNVLKGEKDLLDIQIATKR